jgi:RNA polymerase sigma-70 factor (ECF subfamily)
MTAAGMADCVRGGAQSWRGGFVVTAEGEIRQLAALMRRYADDDPAAFAELHRIVAPRVRAAIRGVADVGASVEDLLQVTMMRAHLARTRFEPPAPDAGAAVLAWYCTIARNVARAWLSESGRRMVPTDDTGFASLPALGDPEQDRIEADGRSAAIDTLDDALAQLPAGQRELITLHKLQGMSFRDIAARLGVRETAARVRAHRAYRALARLLGVATKGDVT